MQATKTKELIRPLPATWWLKKRTYTLFMIREFTSLFVGGYAVFLLVLLYYRGKENKAAFTEAMVCPWSILFQVIALAFVLYHAITWFNLTPKVVVLFRGEERVAPQLIAGAHYVLWLVVSVIVLLVVL